MSFLEAILVYGFLSVLAPSVRICERFSTDIASSNHNNTVRHTSKLTFSSCCVDIMNPRPHEVHMNKDLATLTYRNVVT